MALSFCALLILSPTLTRADSWDPVDNQESGAIKISPSQIPKSHGPHDLGSIIEGSWDFEDWFEVTMLGGNYYLFEVKINQPYSSIRLYDGDGNMNLISTAYNSSDGTVKLIYLATHTGWNKYSLVVDSYGTKTDYSLNYWSVKELVDMNDPIDDDSAKGSRIELSTNLTRTEKSYLSSYPDLDQDWYVFHMDAGEMVEFGASTITGSDVNGIFFDNSLEPIRHFSLSGSKKVIYQAKESGDHYIQLTCSSSYPFWNGSLTARKRAMTSDVWDPSDDRATTATPLDIRTNLQIHGPHLMAGQDHLDFFKVYVTNGYHYMFRIAGNNYNNTIKVYSDTNLASMLSPINSSVEVRANKTGWIIVMVEMQSTLEYGFYDLEYSYTSTRFTRLKAVTNAGLTPFRNGSSAMADLDNDGNLDIVAGGTLSSSYRQTFLLKNNGQGIFTPTNSLYLGPSTYGSISLGDVENDGDIDLFISGISMTGEPRTEININMGQFNFIKSTENLLSPLGNGDSALGDLDGDGDLDLIYTGRDINGSSKTLVYKNSGDGKFILDDSQNIIGLTSSDIALGDISMDGSPDLVMLGMTASGIPITKIYLNDGNGHFNEHSIPLEACYQGNISLADYDADGDTDMIIEGFRNNSYKAVLLYLNDGSAHFTERLISSYYCLNGSSLASADFDNNGTLDLIITGDGYSGRAMTICLMNDGNGNFTEIEKNKYLEHGYSSILPIDANNDGSSDLAVWGYSGYSPVRWFDAKLYKNTILQQNLQPSEPTSLRAVDHEGFWRLEWNAASDDHTPAILLRYQVAATTNTNSGWTLLTDRICYPNDFALLGNAVGGVNPYYQLKVPSHRVLYWKAAALDTSLKLGPWSPIQKTTDVGSPTKPTLSFPIQGKYLATANPNFVWNKSTDVMSGIRNYTLQVSSNNFQFVTYTYQTSGTNQIISSMPAGSWKWRVRAQDYADNLSPWSSTNSFVIDLSGPDITERQPENGKSTSQKSVLLIWNSSDLQSGIVSNWLEIDSDNNGTVDQVFGGTSGMESFLYHKMTAGPFRWRIRSMNQAGINSTYSWFQLTVNTNIPLASLFKPAPESYQAEDSTLFSWSKTSHKGGISNVLILRTNNANIMRINCGTSTNILLNLPEKKYKWFVVSYSTVTAYTSASKNGFTVDKSDPTFTDWNVQSEDVFMGSFQLAFSAKDKVILDDKTIQTRFVIFSNGNARSSGHAITNGIVCTGWNLLQKTSGETNIRNQLEYAGAPLRMNTIFSCYISVSDKAGNTTERRMRLYVLNDTQAPFCGSDPSENSHLSAVDVTMTAWEDSAMSRMDHFSDVHCEVEKSGAGTYFQGSSRSKLVCRLDSSGEYRIRYFAVDLAGNRSLTNERTLSVSLPSGKNLDVYPTIVDLSKGDRLKITLSEPDGNATILLTTLAGHVIERLENVNLSSEIVEYSIRDTRKFPAGRYLVRVGKHHSLFIIVK